MDVRVLVAPFLIVAIPMMQGCRETSNDAFLEMTRSCLSPQLLGPVGEVVFFGPNDYRPGDAFKRAKVATGEWRYTGEYEYARQVTPDTLAKVVKAGTVPAECKLTNDATVNFDVKAEGNALLTSAAVPVSASAGVNLKGGRIASISAKKVYVDVIPYTQPFSESVASLPSGSDFRKAISQGGYYVAFAVLIVEGYSVDVKYGPEFDANAAAQAKLGANDTNNLKASVSLKAKDANTLNFTVQDKTAIAIVARPLGSDFQVQGVGDASVAVVAPSFGALNSRGWK